MNNTLEKINNIPARTWRWLGVNNVSVEMNLPKVKEYNLLNIKEKNEKDFTLLKMDKALGQLKEVDSLTYDGISQETLNQVKKDFNTGAYIKVSSEKKLKEPVFIDYSMDEKNNSLVDNNVIIAEENSEVTVVIKYSSKEKSRSFHNGLTRLYAQKGAVINLIKIQEMADDGINLDANIARLEDDAVVNYTSVDLGGLYSIVNYRNDLYGYKSSSNIYSIYLGDKEREIDINYLINHYGKETKSQISVRGALLDKSSKIFKGTIDFKKGSKKSKGAEEEYVMLLSPGVRNRSVPVLLCTEEDVDGQHAASSGRVDKDKLFYLMCRGLSEKEAKRLLIEAALNPVIDKIPLEDVKCEIYDYIRRKLSDD